MIAPENFDGPPCPVCDATGELRVEGFSINPTSGYRVVDPQCEESAVCPACWGTGIRGYARRGRGVRRRVEQRREAA